jgi:hypothetical protein
MVALMEDFSQRMSLLERNILAGLVAPERGASPAHSASSGEGSLWIRRNLWVLLLPSGATPLGDQPGDMVVTELSEMKAVRALIRQLIHTELYPLPPDVSRPRSSALFALFGVSDEPGAPAFIATRGLDELPPSFSTEKADRLMDTALWDAEHQEEGHQHSGCLATIWEAFHVGTSQGCGLPFRLLWDDAPGG